MIARVSAACLLMCGALAALLAVLECQPNASTPTTAKAVPIPCLALMPVATGQTVPTGTVWNVVAHAGTPPSNDSGACPTDASAVAALPPIDGLVVTFGVTASGATISPTSNVTDVNGMATASIVVPFDTQVAVTVSGGGGEAVALVPPAGGSTSAAAITLVPNFHQVFTWLPGGELFRLDVQVSGAGSDAGIPGFGVAFATTTTGVAFSPATVMTDGTGLASSYVIIPYGAQIQAIVSGGGIVKQQPQTAPPLTLTTAAGLVPTNNAIASGEVYSLTVQARPADSTTPTGGVPGVPLAFTTTTSGVAFSPASVSTDSSGNATSSVLVAYGTQIDAVVSGAGNVITSPAADAGAGISAPVIDLVIDSFKPVQPPVYGVSGQAYALTVTANVQDEAGVVAAVEGLGISFATTTGATFSPATVATDVDGGATSNVVVPYGTQTQAVVSGGGVVKIMPATGPIVTLAPGRFPGRRRSYRPARFHAYRQRHRGRCRNARKA